MNAPNTMNAYGVAPDLLDESQLRVGNRTLLAVVLGLIVLVGFGLRATQLSAEGLSEDELNKLNATLIYRTQGLTSTNGEHPFLMKALMTASTVTAERWNSVAPVGGQMSVETALRLPSVIFGACTALLIFFVTAQLFGTRIGLIAAALWAFDPGAIGFNRIAKEDTFLVFFFLLANAFWLRGQRVAESGTGRPEPYYWATGAAFGAMIASKYMPHLLAISVSYYYVFQAHPRTRWRLGKAKWLVFLTVMGLVFLACNPTILLPGTWHEMRVFASEKRIGHDAYEFMGRLYENKATLWLKGTPWQFYYVFMGIKLPVPVLLAFLVGLPLLFRRRLLGAGRFFILFWLMYWFLPFTFMGGKFTRYFTIVLPVILIVAALGLDFVARWAGRRLKLATRSNDAAGYAYATIVALGLLAPAYAATSAKPYYRLYTNSLGGGIASAGDYFPHDEFYDASVPACAAEIVRQARPGALVANETPALFSYYAQRAGRSDLVSVSLSDPQARLRLGPGDFIIEARGRHYFSNDSLLKQLQNDYPSFVTISLGQIPAARLYQLTAALPSAP